jgi:2-oxo-hept-3-ene-1,7-dioate hydratase
MQLTPAQHSEAARKLYDAHLSASEVAPMSAQYPGADIEDAYAIAGGVVQLKVAAGHQIKGHKVGLTSKAMQSMAAAKEPDYGTLTADYFRYEGATVKRSEMNRPLVEVEIAFVMKHALKGPGVNAADVISATDYILPCLEIVDSRQSRGGPGPLVDTVADAASCGFVVLGGNPRKLHQVDIRRIGAVLLVNGSQEQSGVAAAVMGNPISSVAWLVNKLSEFGVGVEAGQTILSGSFVKAIPFGAGDTLTAIFDTLGEVTLAVAKD